MKFCVEWKRRESWLAPFRITLFADDMTGLLPGEVYGVLEVLPRFRLTLLEVAFDFSGGVTKDTVRAYGLFGKSAPRRKTNATAADYWGSRKGSKFVRAYDKKAIGAYRVELELHARFLRRFRISTPLDFSKLETLLPRRHIFFARLDRGKLAARLQRSRFSAMGHGKILRRVAAMSQDLSAALKYLRQGLRLKNVWRFLVPLQLNALVREALKKWVAFWPAAAPRLDVKPSKQMMSSARTDG